MIEVLEERRDLITSAVEEALEDIYLAQAMETARSEGLADRNQVANALGVRL